LGCHEIIHSIVSNKIPVTSYEHNDLVDVVATVKEMMVELGYHGKAKVGISTYRWNQSHNVNLYFASFGNASGAVQAFPGLYLIGRTAYVIRPKLLDYLRRGSFLEE